MVVMKGRNNSSITRLPECSMTRSEVVHLLCTRRVDGSRGPLRFSYLDNVKKCVQGESGADLASPFKYVHYRWMIPHRTKAHAKAEAEAQHSSGAQLEAKAGSLHYVVQVQSSREYLRIVGSSEEKVE